jgi:hypothetical protein
MEKRMFKSGAVATPDIQDKLDWEARSIFGAVMCQVGEAKGHGVLINQEFIAKLVGFGQAMGELGVKCRFGHPGMCSESLGTQLGRVNNWQLSEDGNQAIADIHFYDAATISPSFSKDPVAWLFKQVEEDADALGMSIVFTGESYQLTKSGKRFNPYTDKPDPEDPAGEEYYADINALYNVDVVEEPAATNGLFSAQFNADKLGVKVFEFLDENPEVMDLLTEKPEVVEGFMKRYSVYLKKRQQKENQESIMNKIKTALQAIKKGYTALFEEEEKYANIDVVTAGGVAVTIVAQGETPQVGDRVVVTGSEENAPEGDHTIGEAPNNPELVGAVITVDGEGLITAIALPEAAAESEEEDDELAEGQVAALNASLQAHKILKAELAKAKTELAEVSATLEEQKKLFEVLKKTPAVASVFTRGDVVVPGAGEVQTTDRDIYMNAPHNKALREAAEKQ